MDDGGFITPKSMTEQVTDTLMFSSRADPSLFNLNPGGTKSDTLFAVANRADLVSPDADMITYDKRMV